MSERYLDAATNVDSLVAQYVSYVRCIFSRTAILSRKSFDWWSVQLASSSIGGSSAVIHVTNMRVTTHTQDTWIVLHAKICTICWQAGPLTALADSSCSCTAFHCRPFFNAKSLAFASIKPCANICLIAAILSHVITDTQTIPRIFAKLFIKLKHCSRLFLLQWYSHSLCVRIFCLWFRRACTTLLKCV